MKHQNITKSAKNYAIIPLLLISIIIGTSCKNQEKVFYTNELTPKEISEAVQSEQKENSYLEGDSTLMMQELGGNKTIRDGIVCFSKDSQKLDEYGIFRVQKSNEVTVARALREYLKEKSEENQSYYESYFPQEAEKARDAEVWVVGDYVAYAVMSAEGKSNFIQSFEKAITISEPEW